MLFTSLLGYLSSLALSHGFTISKSSKNAIVVKESEDVNIWCISSEKYDECEFIMPNGDNCIVKQEDPTCLSNSIFFSGDGNRNCSLTIQNIGFSKNGVWKCAAIIDGIAEAKRAETKIEITIAKKAAVEFLTVFGSVIVNIGKPSIFECEARHGSPSGTFFWRVGEANDPESTLLQNDEKVNVATSETGYLIETQTLWYLPQVSHNNKKLYCIYNQSRENGEVLYSTEDHITLDVYYLEDPKATKIIPSVEIGKSINISFSFGADPKPMSSDVIWKIMDPSSVEIYQFPLESKTIVKSPNGKIEAHPLSLLRTNVYEALLTLHNITLNDIENTYNIVVSMRDKASKAIFMSKESKFNLYLKKGENEFNSSTNDNESDSETSYGLIIGILVFLLILLLLTIAGFTYWSYINQKLCFKDKESDHGESIVPLKTESRSIIKEEFTRPK